MMAINKKSFLVLGVIFFFLWGRLFYLTIVKGPAYRARADQNRLLSLDLDASRGIIYDCHHHPLVVNVPLYQKEGKEISRDEFLLSLSQGEDEKISLSYQRQYLLGPAAAHLLGFLGPVTPEEIKKGKYLPFEKKGRGGVEEFYDDLLRGKPGQRTIEIDARGHFLREVGRKEPISGHDLQLNIDRALQEKAAALLFPQKGAVIMARPRTGAILALVSSPAFDPNLFTLRRQEEKIAALLQDKEHPFLNRALSARYPPGSTFKIITALAALEEGKITKETKIKDVGILRVGDFEYANWLYTKYGRTDGEVDVIKALKRSNDIYFYKVGELLGVDALSSWAKKFHLDKKTGIDLPAEVAGVVPSSSWKEKVKGQPWFLGDTYHFAIGQGDLAVTPLAINAVTNVIANGGWWCSPQVAQNKEGQCQSLGIKKENIDLVRQGMQAACLQGGTGTPFFDFRVNGQAVVACKTGTAEFGLKKGFTHAWFTAFMPIDNPQVSVTVFLEGGGEGSGRAAQIARALFQAYLEENPSF